MEATDNSTNVNSKERLVSVLAGSACIVTGLSRRGWGGAALLAAGAVLVHRGATGHCYACAALGKKNIQASVGGSGQLSRPVPGHGGVLVEKSVTIDKSPEECYRFWRDLENLPRIMSHLHSVVQVSEKQSTWVAKAPLGQTVSWSAEMIRDEPAHYIAWRSLPGSDIENSGSVRFLPATEGTGTIVKVIFEYKPPAGRLGATISALLGEEPRIQVENDLRKFKELIESGEAIDGAATGEATTDEK